MSYNIPCVRNQVAFRQLTYVGKILRREVYHVPMRLLIAWCDNLRKRGIQLVTNKDSLVMNLRLVLPDVDDAGSLSTWGFHALDAKYWFLLLSILKHPSIQTPEKLQMVRKKMLKRRGLTLPTHPPSSLVKFLLHNRQTCRQVQDLPLLEHQEITEY